MEFKNENINKNSNWKNKGQTVWVKYFLLIQHYNDVIMGAMASQITSLTIVYSTVYWGVDQRKHQSSASLALVWGIHRWPVNSPHKCPVMRKVFPFDEVIMRIEYNFFPVSISTVWCSDQDAMVKKLEQNGRNIRDDFPLTEYFLNLIKIPLNFIRECPAWCRTNDNPSAGPMVIQPSDIFFISLVLNELSFKVWCIICYTYMHYFVWRL